MVAAPARSVSMATEVSLSNPALEVGDGSDDGEGDGEDDDEGDGDGDGEGEGDSEAQGAARWVTRVRVTVTAYGWPTVAKCCKTIDPLRPGCFTCMLRGHVGRTLFSVTNQWHAASALHEAKRQSRCVPFGTGSSCRAAVRPSHDGARRGSAHAR